MQNKSGDCGAGILAAGVAKPTGQQPNPRAIVTEVVFAPSLDIDFIDQSAHFPLKVKVVVGDGFEPSKAKPANLQFGAWV